MAPVQTQREEQGLAAPRGCHSSPVAAGQDVASALLPMAALLPAFVQGYPKRLFFFFWSAPKAALGHLKAGFEAHQVLSAFPRCRGASEQRGRHRAHTVFPALPTDSSGLFLPRGCSPWDHTMHRVEAAELEQLRRRERDNLGIPRASGCASVPCTSQPLCRARFSLPGDSQLCLLGQCVGTGVGISASQFAGGTLFSQATILFALSPLTEAV